MAQSGYTPISLYFSATGAAVPTAGNLVAGELALNTNDGKLYFKNSSGVVTLLAGSTSGPAGGSTTQVQYNNAGVLAGITGATSNGTALTLVAPNLGSPSSVGTMPAFTLGGTIAGGGNQINNVVIGTTTPLAGAFTSLTASTTLGVTGVSTLTGGAVVQGLTVGLGAGAVASNTAVGVSAIAASATGANNTALGFESGNAITSGANNTLLGYRAGKAVTNASGNAVLGDNALLVSTGGGFNVAVGNSALQNNTASENVAIGSGAATANTSGTYNVAVGRQALALNDIASNNTAVGYQAGYSNTTGTLFTALGYQAGYASLATNRGTYIGSTSGLATTGAQNTFVGDTSGSLVTIGASNTILGRYTGNQGGLDIRTASNYIVLSDGDGNPRAYWNGANATFAGGLTGGTSGTAYSFSGSAPATSLTLDASGNLGLGVTPSAWNSNWRAFQFGTGGSLSNAISQASLIELGGNFYQDTSGTERYIASSTANKYRQYAGAHTWYSAASGTAGDPITFTQAMTLDASGNLGIGTTSPSTYGKFVTYSSGGYFAVDTNGHINSAQLLDVATAGGRFVGTSSVGVLGHINVSQTTTSSAGGYISFSPCPSGSVSPTERMRLDSAGNLGLGVTPSAWGTGNNVRALQMNAGSLWSYTTDALTMAQNSYYNGTNYIYSITSTATQYVQVAGQHQWFNAASGTAGNVITFTQAMTLGASGNLGIGTTSPAARLTVAKSFNISNDGVYAPASASGTGLNFGFDGAGTEQSWIQALRNNTSETRNLLLNTLGGNVLVGAISNTSGGGCLQISNGITFPATQSASSDANTLDDYEEGTWTPSVGDQTVVGTFSSNGNYTKIGRQVFFRGQVYGSTSITGAAGSFISGLPFTSALSGTGIGTNAFLTASTGIFIGPSDNKVYIIGGYAATGNFEFSGMYFV